MSCHQWKSLQNFLISRFSLRKPTYFSQHMNVFLHWSPLFPALTASTKPRSGEERICYCVDLISFRRGHLSFYWLTSSLSKTIWRGTVSPFSTHWIIFHLDCFFSGRIFVSKKHFTMLQLHENVLMQEKTSSRFSLLKFWIRYYFVFSCQLLSLQLSFHLFLLECKYLVLRGLQLRTVLPSDGVRALYIDIGSISTIRIWSYFKFYVEMFFPLFCKQIFKIEIIFSSRICERSWFKCGIKFVASISYKITESSGNEKCIVD